LIVVRLKTRTLVSLAKELAANCANYANLIGVISVIRG
jgi:hypothetical protein